MSRKMFAILIAIVALMLFLVVPEILTGQSVFDAYLSSRGMNLSITLDWTPPDLELVQPENTSYPENAVPIEWNATDEHSAINTVWYNINHGANITLTAPGNITVSEGSYTFYLFANDTNGNENSSSISFTTYDVVAPPEEPGPGGGPGGGGGVGDDEEENVTEEVVEEVPTEVPAEEIPTEEVPEDGLPGLIRQLPYSGYGLWYIIVIALIAGFILFFLFKRKKRKRYSYAMRQKKWWLFLFAKRRRKKNERR